MKLRVTVEIEVDDDSIQEKLEQGYTKQSIISEIAHSIKSNSNYYIYGTDVIDYKEVE